MNTIKLGRYIVLHIVNGAIIDDAIQNNADAFINNDSTSNRTEQPENNRPYAELWDAMQNYNAGLPNTQQELLRSVDDYIKPSFVLTEYGLEDNIFGVISIPKLEVSLPVYQEMRRVSDELCQEYGLSIIDNPNPMKGKHYGEVVAEQHGRPTWRGIIKNDVDEAIRISMTERQFYGQLRKMGYEVKLGKYLYIKPQGKERFVRLSRQLGEDYTIESIRNRILRQQQPSRPMPEPKTHTSCGKMKGSYRKTKKTTGLRALYLHYCYLLGVFPKKKKQSRKRLHFLLKEDLLKLDQITKEAKLLGKHRIDTVEQLSSYQLEVEQQIALLTAQRKELYRKQRIGIRILKRTKSLLRTLEWVWTAESTAET